MVQVLHVREGRVIGAAEYPFSDVRIEDGDVMSSFLGQYYGLDQERQVPAEVLSVATGGETQTSRAAGLSPTISGHKPPFSRPLPPRPSTRPRTSPEPRR